jgi:hypothetical protein
MSVLLVHRDSMPKSILILGHDDDGDDPTLTTLTVEADGCFHALLIG